MSQPPKKRQMSVSDDIPEPVVGHVPQREPPAEASTNAHQHEFTHVLVIDIETTGPNCVRNFMLEFAASLWKIGDTCPLDTFYVALDQPADTEWCPRTRKEFWENPKKGIDGVTPLEALKSRLSASECIVSPAEGMTSFCHWASDSRAQLLKKQPDARILVGWDTAEFDSAFINVYLGRYTPDLCPNINLLFGEYQSTRDLDAFYYGMGGQIKRWGAEEVALRGLGIEKFPKAMTDVYKATHNPYDDAEWIGAVASFLLARAQEANEDD